MNTEYRKRNNRQGLALESRTPRRGLCYFSKTETSPRNPESRGLASVSSYGIFSALLFFVLFSCFILPSSASAFQKPPNNLGLVGYWSLDDGAGTIATDMSGKGSSGTLTNGPSWINGKRGKAVRLDGTDDFINMGDASPLKITGTAITVSAWVRHDSDSFKNWEFIAGKGDSTYRLSLCGGTSLCHGGATLNGFVFAINDGSNLSVGSSIVPVTGRWYHVAATYDGTIARLYVDGVQSATDSYSLSINNDTREFYIGENSQSTGRQWTGAIDEVRVYTRVLTATEISALYGAGSAKFTTPSSTGLVGYWSMDDATSTIASDFSGNKNNGTLTTFTNPATPLSGWLTAGKHGGALTFDGTSDFVDVGNVSTLDMGTSDWTTSAWVKTGDTSSNPMMVSKMQFVGGAVDAWYMELLSSGRLHAGLFKGGRTIQNTADDGATINDNKWHHIAVTWTRSGNLLRYVDGVVTGSAKDISGEAGQNIANSQKVNIGARDAGAGNELFYKGSIDDVRVYRRALSAAEIAGLYRSGQVTTNASQNNKVTNGLVGYWSFNGQDIDWGKNIFYDRSGQGNNATSTGMSTTTSITAGVSGQALNFDGLTSGLAMNVNATILNDLGPVTYSAWIKPRTAGGSGRGTIFSKPVLPSALYVFNIEGGSNTNALRFIRDGIVVDLTRISANNVITLGVWQHVLVTWDGSVNATGVHIYVNGTETAYSSSINASGGFDSNATAPMLLGKNIASGGTRHFDGEMDEMRIYNRVLSAVEIKQLYNMGRSQ